MMLWGALDIIAEFAIGVRWWPFVEPDPGWQYAVIFCTFAPSVFLCGPFAFVVVVVPERVRGSIAIRKIVAWMWWASCTLPPAVFVLLQMRNNDRWNIDLGMGGLSVYLLVAGLVLLTARYRQAGGTALFWLGIIPVATCALAWLGLLILVVAYEEPVAWIAGVGNAGALSLLAGWLRWWHAVAKAGRAETRDSK
jgi:hypothetical protein